MTDTAWNEPGLALATLVERGWDRHARDPRAVAEALLARAAALPGDDDGAAALRLAEHVLLGHLADVDAYQHLVEALPGALSEVPATAPMRERMAWSLAMLRGDAAATPPPDASRWRALHGLWSVAVARDQCDAARAQLEAEQALALAHPDSAARQALAGTCNNLAGDLLDGPRGDPARDRLMLAAAQAARALWGSAGTWVHAERADWMLSRCHAAAGDAAAALRHALDCLATIQAHAQDPQADAFERFFAREALAWAHRAAGDLASARREREAAAGLLPGVADAGLRGYAEGELAKLSAALR